MSYVELSECNCLALRCIFFYNEQILSDLNAVMYNEYQYFLKFERCEQVNCFVISEFHQRFGESMMADRCLLISKQVKYLYNGHVYGKKTRMSIP